MLLLIACPEEAAAQGLAERLRTEGLRVAGATTWRNLVREAVRLAPEAVVVDTSVVDEALLDALVLLQAGRAVPVLLCCKTLQAAQADRALAGGVMHVDHGPADAARLQLAMPLARARFQHLQALQRELAGALARLEERKWVDRAKGMLMSAQQLSEPDAFALLRTTSMQTNLRVGEVSRALIEAAEAADAVNRAGQLRMLSQRIVKALALSQAGVERAAAEDMLRDSVARVQANVDQLAALQLAEGLEPLRAQALQAWQALHGLLQGSGPAIDLDQLDQRAQVLLDAAQAFTDALQAASGRRNLQVVNLSGRQRMLSQRLAKQALLAGLLPAAQGQQQTEAALAAVTEFDTALQQLEQAPLASQDIREALAVARGQWQRMLAAMRDARQRDSRLVLARESEALLQSFERLTSLYERSIQLLLG